MKNLLVAFVLTTSLIACSTSPGPDKTIVGSGLGAGWGAGAGAAVGNHIGRVGQGTAVGAGFGLVSGALGGMVADAHEAAISEERAKLKDLSQQNVENRSQLASLQERFDLQSDAASLTGVQQIYFDVDETSLKSGSIATVEALAESIKRSLSSLQIKVVGHADDSGSTEYNERLALARANSVASVLASKGVNLDKIKVSQKGSAQPIASNSTPTGRQFNRRVDVYWSQAGSK